MQNNSQNIAAQGEFLGHPKGLFLLCATEMWERFSYYGMRALLVLSMVAATKSANPGFGWSDTDALELYGTYTGLSYLFVLVGGWLADNYLGQRRAVVFGAMVMAAGQFTLASSVGTNLQVFYIGLGLLIIGSGLFKANLSTMVGELYQKHDARRDAAFSIFYMGINLGAFVAPLICSSLGESPNYGWKFGYAAAGVGMVIGTLTQVFLAQRYLGDIGRKPAALRAKAESGGVKLPLTSDERDRLKVIFVLFIFVMLFWASFEQAGGLMNLYAFEKTNRMLSGFEIPAGWFQSVNSLFIIMLAPLFAMLWSALAKRGKSMPTPVKMVSGLLLTAFGFLFMVAAVFDQEAHGKANMIWLILAYLFHTMGELCISPVGLSMVTKLAPLRLSSLMMGVWFLMNAAANKLSGIIGAYAEQAGELTVFAGLAIVLSIFAFGLWLLSDKLVDWVHGAENVAAKPAAQPPNQVQ